MSALSIRRDRTPRVLRKLARAESDGRIARRILAIANVLDGMSRENAAQSAGMNRQTLRDWVIRYNEHGLDGLADLRVRDARRSSTPRRRRSSFASCLPVQTRRQAAFRPSHVRTWCG